jgi:hypothetical protein
MGHSGALDTLDNGAVCCLITWAVAGLGAGGWLGERDAARSFSSCCLLAIAAAIRSLISSVADFGPSEACREKAVHDSITP